MKYRKRILILGAAGFIGRNLVEEFKTKYYLLTPSHRELDFTNEPDVSRYFRLNKVDVVINGIVVGGSRKEEHEENALSINLRIFFNIIKNSKYYEKLIHLGSGAEYDKTRSLKRITESNFGKRIPSDEYGLFKYICSKYIENSSDNIVNLRLFGLFGKYEDYRYRFISQAICRNICGLPITIKQNVFFDYVYIKDFTKIVEYFINNRFRFKSYNIGSGKRIDIISLARIINDVSGIKSKLITEKRGLNNEYTCNNRRLRSELHTDFKLTPLKKSIKELYNWYMENKEIINENFL